MNNIMCLCGSTKFKQEYLNICKEMTLKGFIIVMPGLFAHAGDKISNEQKEALDALHLHKIDISDTVYIINKNGYIGSSTKNEINYAKSLNKKIIYMEKLNGN